MGPACSTEPSPPLLRGFSAAGCSRLWLCDLWTLFQRLDSLPAQPLFIQRTHSAVSGSQRWAPLCPPPGRPGALPARAHTAFTEQAGRELHLSTLVPPTPGSGCLRSQGCPGIRTRPWETSLLDPGVGRVDRGFWPRTPVSQAWCPGAQMPAKGEAPGALGSVGPRGWEGLPQRPSEAESAAGDRRGQTQVL